MARSSFLKSLAALAIVAAITYFVILPMLNQGQGGVILGKKHQKGGNDKQTSSTSQNSDSRDASNSYSSATKGGYIYRGPDGPVSNYLASLPPAAPLKGTSGPYIKAITLRIPRKIFLDYGKPGYYFVESKICWENCGCGDKHVFNLVDLTKMDIKQQSMIVPPQSAVDDIVIFAVPSNPLEPVWYFYIPRTEVDKVLPSCEGRPYDYLVVESRVLYGGSSKDPSKATPISGWMKQLRMRIDLMPPASNREIDVYEEGVDFVEVNGYVHMLLPTHSVAGAPLVVNATALEIFIALLALVGLIWYWKVRR